jgi:hypothetical protein
VTDPLGSEARNPEWAWMMEPDFVEGPRLELPPPAGSPPGTPAVKVGQEYRRDVLFPAAAEGPYDNGPYVRLRDLEARLKAEGWRIAWVCPFSVPLNPTPPLACRDVEGLAVVSCRP